VIVSRDNTTIIEGSGSEESIVDRVDMLKSQLRQNLETYEIAALKQRLSSLAGSVAIFKVGGISESEVKERKDRVEDAINAVKAAIEEGIVPGGGAALLHCVPVLKSLKNDKSFITEELIGVDVIMRAIRAPFIQILDNTNEIEYGVWVYYPWTHHVLHIVDEVEFIELRTNRNQYKITPDEQSQLQTKKVGVIGLSVGHEIAMTMVTELDNRQRVITARSTNPPPMPMTADKVAVP